MSETAWDILGLDEAAEHGDVRRTYARLLKQTHPEDDPEGFKKLRWAYDYALGYVDWREREALEAADGQGPSVAAPISANGAASPASDAPAPESPESPATTVLVNRSIFAAPVEEDPAQRERRRIEREAQELEAGHAVLRGALEQQLDRPEAQIDEDAIRAAFADLCASPAMDSVLIHQRTEHWIASLISHFDGGDALVEAASNYFGWGGKRIDQRNLLAPNVYTRQQDKEAVAALARKTSRHNRAYKALSVRPVGRRLWLNRLSVSLPRDVRNLLALLREKQPGVLPRLNPDALAWWERYLSRPQLGPAAIWTMIVGPLVLAMLAAAATEDTARPIPYLVAWSVSVAPVGIGVLVWIFGIETTRHLWRERWADRAPPWVRYGWIGAIPAILLLSAAVPATLAGGALIAILAVLAAYWAVVTGELDRRESLGESWNMFGYVSVFTMGFYITQMIWRPGMRYPAWLRTVFGFAYLAIFWFGAHFAMPLDSWLQMSIPVLAGAVAFSVGAMTLMRIWFGQLARKTRVWGLSGLIAAVAGTGALLWFSLDFRPLAPLAAACVVVLVFLQKTPGYGLSKESFVFRDIVVRYGWAAWLFVFAVAGLVQRGRSDLLFYGVWLLGGVLAAAVLALREWKQEGLPRHAMA